MQYFHRSWKNFAKNAKTFAQLPKRTEKCNCFQKNKVSVDFSSGQPALSTLLQRNFAKNPKKTVQSPKTIRRLFCSKKKNSTKLVLLDT